MHCNTDEKNNNVAEYLRPWKLALLALGLVSLVVGARYSGLPDWNISVSVILAFATYLSAPWVVRVFVKRQWALMPVALLAAWGVVYGCYIGYWWFANPQVLDALPRLVIADVAGLYVLAGIIWCYNGTLASLTTELRSRLRIRGGTN